VGGAVGVLAGGILVEFVSWRWIFLLNVPIGLVVLFLVPKFVDESRGEGRPKLDLGGAFSITGGLALLIYGLTRAETDGWGDSVTIAVLVVAASLILGSLFIEKAVRDPLLPLGIFRNRTLSGANVVGFLLGASIFAMFFFISLYMLQVLGYSALGVGTRYLLFAVVIILAAGASQALVTRFGIRPILAIGMLLLTAGLVYFTFIEVDGSYTSDLVPGFILAGLGLGFSFVPVSIAALQGVEDRLAGVASGLINTSQQVGGAVGIAILSTVATTTTSGRVDDAAAAAAAAGGDPAAAAQAALPQALVDGFANAFWVGGAMAVVGLVCTLFIIQKIGPRDAAAMHGAPGL
jgi:predicted MFS family arabinose efflux permease